MRTVAVIQARMGSARLPGKVLAEIGGRPLILSTVAAVEAVAGIDALVVAPADRRPGPEVVGFGADRLAAAIPDVDDGRDAG
jgi:spore coat polysaccharide biosynthesis protein SpsF